MLFVTSLSYIIEEKPYVVSFVFNDREELTSRVHEMDFVK